jgi:hypothetical protein
MVPLDSLRSLGTPLASPVTRVACHERATRLWASRVVRKKGLEPSRPCGRQPLKLVRLPFRHFRVVLRWSVCVYFAGAGAGAVEGAAGAGVAGAGAGFAVAGAGAGVPLTTELVPRWPITDKVSANSMNSTAAIDVALVSSVAPDRAPNAAWLLLPPNALAISPPRPCCRRMTSESTRQTRT